MREVPGEFARERNAVITFVSARPAFAGALALHIEPAFGPVRVILPDRCQREDENANVLVVDCVQHPGAFGLVRRAAFSDGAPRIVAVVSRPSDYISNQAREAGAHAVLSDLDGLEAWTDVLNRIAVAPGFRAGPSFATGTRILQFLTNRQVDVFRCVLRGLTDAEMGEELGITTATVETHRRDLMRKVGVTRHDRLPLVGVQLGVIDPCELPPLSAFRQASRVHCATA